MSKWSSKDKIIYSNSYGETVASAWQKQIKINDDFMEKINRLRNLDSQEGNDSDTVAYQLKVSSNALYIRNESNTQWLKIGSLRYDNFSVSSTEGVAGYSININSKKDGAALVYRDSANSGRGGIVFESVSASSIIKDSGKSISTTYSSSKIDELISSIKSSSSSTAGSITSSLEELKENIKNNYLSLDGGTIKGNIQVRGATNSKTDKSNSVVTTKLLHDVIDDELSKITTIQIKRYS